MESYDPSRRSLLRALAGVIAAAATPLGWAQIAQAWEHVHAARQTGTNGGTISFLSAAEAADIEAVAAQIIPTDDSPGAREAGVIYFIDRALATLVSQLAADYRAQLADFQSGYRQRHPNIPSFGSLACEQQIDYLRAACVHCGFCHGFACEVFAKASTLTTVIPEAEATGKCEVRSESYVFRIETNKQGRVTGVSYFDRDRRERLQLARAAVVCANGAETPRLLLMSANTRFPHGLANSSGLVGKYLMFNSNTRALGVFEHELNEHKSVQVTRILHDFYDSDPKRGHYGGGGLDARIGPQPTTWAIRTATEGPSWGSAFKARLKEFPRSMQVACHGTSLPVESNNVTLDPELKDAWGLPAIRATYKDHPDDLATARFLQNRGAEILEAAGALRVTKAPVIEQTSSVHLLGTCRMGNDPATSVIDKFHRSHDIPNLFICDGSSLVTSGRGQPTMTIQALAFRAGEHIAQFAKRGEI